MRCLRLILPAGYLGLLFPLMILGGRPALRSGAEDTTIIPSHGSVFQVSPTPTISGETPSAFEISLAELGYSEQVLNSPYGLTEYSLRLPEGWNLREGSSFELNFSYTYDRLEVSEAGTSPSLLGDIAVVVDGETQTVFTIKEPELKDFGLSIALPASLLNDPTRIVHTVSVILDASLICDIPHRASLIIHPASFFSLKYDQLPVIPDLAHYPRPFYQRAFEPDRVRFVLPVQPAETDLAGAAAIAAKLGDLTYGLIISGTTDLELINRLAAGEVPREHLIVIGKPESNRMILELNQLGLLPVPLRERELSLSSQGPATIVSGGILSYTLTLTNTAQKDLSDLSLVDMLPAYARVLTCSSSCSQAVDGEVNWAIPSLGVGEVSSYTLALRLSEVITDSVVENTLVLRDAESNPLNVNTLTTRVSSAPSPESGQSLSVSGESKYFALQAKRAVSEQDGIVQELVSPWDETRAILIVTGLNDEAVYKASQAMSFQSNFPGLQGPFALVREVHPMSGLSPERQGTAISFSDLGYDDRVLRRFSEKIDYEFGIPLDWRLTEAAYLELHFSHSQLIDYRRSFMTVLFNDKPMATVAFSDESALGGVLKVALPLSAARQGELNRISVQVKMQPVDVCSGIDLWLRIGSESLLHLDHKQQSSHSLDLKFYPQPFDGRSDLADVLFVLPAEPQLEEWEQALQLIAGVGNAIGSPDFMPAVMLGDTRSEEELSDYHLILIGRASRNPLLQRINAQLPQPFLPGSDLIQQKLDEVIFRLPPDLSLGYVQLIPSPWNETRALMAVTGTTDKGVDWAIRALTSGNLSWQLKGNLALIRDTNINSLDTRTLSRGYVAAAVATAVPEMTPETEAVSNALTSTPTPTSITADAGQSALQESQARDTSHQFLPSWITLLVGFTIIVTALVLTIAFRQSRRPR
jgi:uncharacterized repeat protein (TIGR01451 family)